MLNIPRQIIRRIQFHLREPVAHEREFIGGAVRKIKIFASNTARHPPKQEAASGKRSRDPPVHAILLVPGATGTGPGQGLVDLIAVPRELIDGFLFNYDGFNILSRHLVEPHNYIFGRPTEPFN